jgi:hypothetical protein
VGATPPNNCPREISGRFPVDFQVNSGNSQGFKKCLKNSILWIRIRVNNRPGQLKTLRSDVAGGGHGQIPFLSARLMHGSVHVLTFMHHAGGARVLILFVFYFVGVIKFQNVFFQNVFLGGQNWNLEPYFIHCRVPVYQINFKFCAKIRTT